MFWNEDNVLLQLLMAYKTRISLGLDTGPFGGRGGHARKGYGNEIVNQSIGGCFNLSSFITHRLFFMAFSTIVHFHPVPGIFLETTDAFSPDITAVTGNPVFFINF